MASKLKQRHCFTNTKKQKTLATTLPARLIGVAVWLL